MATAARGAALLRRGGGTRLGSAVAAGTVPVPVEVAPS